MACGSGTKFRIQSNGTIELTANDDTKDACTAAKLLDRLHDDFTKKTRNTMTSNVPDDASVPSFWLRNQDKVSGFTLMNETGTSTTNRFTTIFTSQTSKDQPYRTAVHAIMNGVYQPNIDEQYYLKNPATAQTDLSAPDNFKGINGLINLNNVLENLITEKVRAKTGSSSVNIKILDDAQHYSKRQEIKTTLEEIARRENEIYREKFLNIILVLVGVFVIGTLLSKKFYSGGGGGGGGSGSGLFGNTFTGVGLGSSSGIFS
ncbi:hypothetical protein EBV26_20645, partial [bacterium]|nr:hypothetical protein [bacterium]